MNKICKVCGATVPSNAKFCQACGSSEFIKEIDDGQTGLLNEVEQPSYEVPPMQNQTPYGQSYVPPVQNQNFQQHNFNQQGWQPPVPQPQPKKKNTGLIVAIVGIAVLILAGIGMAAEKIFQEQGYGDGGSSSDSGYDFNIGTDDNFLDNDTESDVGNGVTVEYTKGTFDGTTYINEWADIKLALPAGFSNGDSSLYSAAENSTTDCGAYFMADDTMSLIFISFEELPTYMNIDEEKYLDATIKNMENTDSGLTYETTDVYSTKLIGGNIYKAAVCKFKNANGSFVQSAYVRKIDDRMVLISVAAVSSEACDALVSEISAAN